jgi:hypothetical protein
MPPATRPWCSNGLTGAEVQVRLAIGVRGNFLRPTRAMSCWTGHSLQCVWTLLGLAVFNAVVAQRRVSLAAKSAVE